MKVLYWTPHFLPSIGGSEVMASRLLPALQARGHEFVVLTSAHRDADAAVEDVGGVEVRRFAMARALADRDIHGIAAVVRHLAAVADAFRPDLIHVNHAGPTAFFHLRTWRPGRAPVVLTFHTPLPDRADAGDTVLGAMLRSSTWITAVSASTLADVRTIAPAIAGRSSVIYNGVPLPGTAPAPPPPHPHLLYVGRLAHEKGVDLVIRALAIVRRQMSCVRLTIAGDGPVRDALHALALACGVADAVSWTGWVPPAEVPALMNASTLVIVPSRYREPFGLVAVEAALMRRPVVAARVGGLEEVIVDRNTGVLVPPDDAEALASAITELLPQPNIRDRLADAACRRARQCFSLDACAGTYDTLYRRLAAMHG